MKSMGGTDNKNNRVLLTAKEHYIAHYLLWKIYRNKESALAFLYMCNDGNRTGIKISSRVYEEIRIECAKISSEAFKFEWKNPETRKKLSIANSIKNKGRKHSDESRKNMSEAHKGFKPSQESINKRLLKVIGRKQSPEHINKRVLKAIGRKLSDETKRKISESAKHSELRKKPRKQYKLISPNNTEYIFDGLKMVLNFATENNISRNMLTEFKNKGKIISKNKNTKNSENWELIFLKRI